MTSVQTVPNSPNVKDTHKATLEVLAPAPDNPSADLTASTRTVNSYDFGMPVHPLCDLFPLMSGTELECLDGDVMENGLVHPIVVHYGQIVDGRNRILACRGAGVKPRFVEWREIYSGSETLARWIWSMNAERRHLTVDQWLAVQVAFQSWEEQQSAKVKQQATQLKAAGPGRGHKTVPTNSSEPFSKPQKAPDVRTKLAKKLNVSEHKVQQALNVQKANPELLKQVARGQSSLLEADKKVKKPAPSKTLPLFEVEACLRPIMRSVDTVLSRVTDEQRQVVLKELIATLRRM